MALCASKMFASVAEQQWRRSILRDPNRGLRFLCWCILFTSMTNETQSFVPLITSWQRGKDSVLCPKSLYQLSENKKRSIVLCDVSGHLEFDGRTPVLSTYRPAILSKLKCRAERAESADLLPVDDDQITDLNNFVIWARSSGILFDKLELKRWGTDGRGCFAAQDIVAGEIFLRVPESIYNLFSTRNSSILNSLLTEDLLGLGISSEVLCIPPSLPWIILWPFWHYKHLLIVCCLLSGVARSKLAF